MIWKSNYKTALWAVQLEYSWWFPRRLETVVLRCVWLRKNNNHLIFVYFIFNFNLNINMWIFSGSCVYFGNLCLFVLAWSHFQCRCTVCIAWVMCCSSQKLVSFTTIVCLLMTHWHNNKTMQLYCTAVVLPAQPTGVRPPAYTYTGAYEPQRREYAT